MNNRIYNVIHPLIVLIKCMVVVLMFQVASANAVEVWSAQSGNWSDTNTWVSNTIPTGGSGNNVLISNGHTVVVQQGDFANFGPFGRNLTIESGATFVTEGTSTWLNVTNYGTFHAKSTASSYMSAGLINNAGGVVLTESLIDQNTANVLPGALYYTKGAGRIQYRSMISVNTDWTTKTYEPPALTLADVTMYNGDPRLGSKFGSASFSGDEGFSHVGFSTYLGNSSNPVTGSIKNFKLTRTDAPPGAGGTNVLVDHVFDEGTGTLNGTLVDGGTLQDGSFAWISHSQISADGVIALTNPVGGISGSAYLDLGAGTVTMGTDDDVYELTMVVDNEGTGSPLITGGHWDFGDINKCHDNTGSPWFWWRGAAPGEFNANTGKGAAPTDLASGTNIFTGGFETFTFVLQLTNAALTNCTGSLYHGDSSSSNLMGSALFSGDEGFRYIGIGGRTWFSNHMAGAVIQSIKFVKIPSEIMPPSSNAVVLIDHAFTNGAGSLNGTLINGGSMTGTLAWVTDGGTGVTANGEINVTNYAQSAYIDLGGAITVGTTNDIYELEVQIDNTTATNLEQMITAGYWAETPNLNESHNEGEGSAWWRWKGNGRFEGETGLNGIYSDVAGIYFNTEGGVMTFTTVIDLTEPSLTNSIDTNIISIASDTLGVRFQGGGDTWNHDGDITANECYVDTPNVVGTLTGTGLLTVNNFKMYHLNTTFVVERDITANNVDMQGGASNHTLDLVSGTFTVTNTIINLTETENINFTSNSTSILRIEQSGYSLSQASTDVTGGLITLGDAVVSPSIFWIVTRDVAGTDYTEIMLPTALTHSLLMVR